MGTDRSPCTLWYLSCLASACHTSVIDINSIRCFDACLLLPRKHVKLFGWFSRGLWTAADCMCKPGAQALFFFTLSSHVSPYPSVFASVFLCVLHFVLFTPDIKICLGWFDYKCKVKTRSKTFTLHCICSVNSNLHPSIHSSNPDTYLRCNYQVWTVMCLGWPLVIDQLRQM